MKYYLLSDTHFGHAMLIDKGLREEGFEEKILKGLTILGGDDILIHLGDVCIGRDEYWHSKIPIGFKKILVRGNHDNKSDTWYYNNGWDMVCDAFQLNKFDKKILFTHEPIPNHKCDINIHGHWHGNDHRWEPGFAKWYDNHMALSIEEDFKPINLRKFLCV